MHPLKIQYELKKRGYTQKQIAAEEGRNEMLVHNAIFRKRTSHPMMAAIARRLGKDPAAVFPDRWDETRRRKQNLAA